MFFPADPLRVCEVSPTSPWEPSEEQMCFVGPLQMSLSCGRSSPYFVVQYRNISKTEMEEG